MYLSQIADRISFIVGGGDEFSISLGVYIYNIYTQYYFRLAVFMN